MTTIKPRILPRNVRDLMICAGVLAYQGTILFAFPFLLTSFLFQSVWMGAIALLLICCIYILFVVSEIRADEKGITFVRILGRPTFIAWAQLEEVIEVSEKELVWKGWIWPLFPAREMTSSLTASGHYRISWSDGWCYFPPRDPAQMLEVLEAQRADL